MNAYAVAGCMRVTPGKPVATPDGPVIAAPWDTMTHYVEFVMDKVDAHPGPTKAALAWAIQGDMEAWPTGCTCAAVRAQQESHASLLVRPLYKPTRTSRQCGLFRLVLKLLLDPMPLQSVRRSGWSQLRKKTKMPRGTDTVQHIDGASISKPFTDGRGCKGGCKAAHACDVKGCKSPWSHPHTGHHF